MNTPLASRLPDFGPGDTPKTIEDHSPRDAAASDASTSEATKSGARTPENRTPEAKTPEAARPDAATRGIVPASTKPKSRNYPLKTAGNTLKSVVRHIKIADEPPAPPPVDVDALLKEHGDKVRAEEAAKAAAALETALAGERKAHEAQRRKERAEWVATESKRLAEQIDKALADVADEVSESMARIFSPFLKAAIRDRAIGDLREMVLAMVAEADEARIEMTGPADLIDAMREAIASVAPARAERIVLTVADSIDVRVVIGDTVCATQLAAWNRRIESALGPL